MTITKKEAELIDRIVHDLYQPMNGGEPASFDDLSDIWAECVLESKADGGVFASLMKKGLAGYSEGDSPIGALRKDSTVWLTQAGWDVYVSQVREARKGE